MKFSRILVSKAIDYGIAVTPYVITVFKTKDERSSFIALKGPKGITMYLDIADDNGSIDDGITTSNVIRDRIPYEFRPHMWKRSLIIDGFTFKKFRGSYMYPLIAYHIPRLPDRMFN
ncbi:MAG: hypothetical protein NC131_09990 [Roseburia sp.]|nr:hypothetical protein [Roseburia sp.]